MRRWSKRKKMYHGQLLDFLVRFGGGNDPLKWQNRAIGGFWENVRFIRSNTQKRVKRDISETALPITISKFQKHFSIQTTPQNLGKITSETTFSHSKVVVWPLLRIKRAFSQNPPMARFWKFRGSFPSSRPLKKSKSQAWYIFLHKNHLLIPCDINQPHISGKYRNHWREIWSCQLWFSSFSQRFEFRIQEND